MYGRYPIEPLIAWSDEPQWPRRRVIRPTVPEPIRAVEPEPGEVATPDEPAAEREAPPRTAAVQALEEQLARARASEAQLVEEFRNYRRHAERERAEARGRAQVELLAELADTVHALELASEAPADDPGGVREGIALVARKLQKVFDAHGLQRIATRGEAFDPALHEAVLAEVAAGVDNGTIVREVSPGFRTAERVIRPAKVVVAQ